MSETSILSREEFLQRTGLSEEEMDRWMRLGLIVPAGRTAGKAALFFSSQLETAQTIRALLSLGYDDEKVARIVRKVGLPRPAKGGEAVPEKLRTVGELAEECGVNPRTIKHWEEKELLEPDARSEGGFRLYGPAVVARCRRIMDLQNIGFTLEEIREARGLLDEPASIVEGLRAEPSLALVEAAERQNTVLRERLERVAASARRLEELLRQRAKAIATCRAMLSKKEKTQRGQK